MSKLWSSICIRNEIYITHYFVSNSASSHPKLDTEMKDAITLGCVVSFIALAATFFSGLVYLSKLTNVLKQRHAAVWDLLGRPIPFGNSIQTSLKFKQFVRNPETYLQDDEVMRLARTVRIIKKLHMLAFVFVIGCFVLMINSNHS